MKYIILLLLVFSVSGISQTDSLKQKPWTFSGVAGLNINQIALSNWSAGGDNSIAWTMTWNFGALYQSGAWKVNNNLKLAYGRTKLGSDEYRTNDNEFYLENILVYELKWAVSPFFSNTVRTTLSEGYNYKVNPALKIADFFDPGYITQSLGFTYDKLGNIKTRLGIALQEIFTKDFTGYSDDSKTTEIEKFKLETGFESVSEADFKIDDNVFLNSKLRLFSRFKTLDVWDVRWDNTITAKISKYFNVNLNILTLYEKALSPKTQLKEALQFGVTYILF
jgi:hypothetical protein